MELTFYFFWERHQTQPESLSEQREVGGAHFSTKQPRADIIQQTFDTDTFNAVYRYALS